jgi:tetratricopeptide (TPR) repeat protein
MKLKWLGDILKFIFSNIIQVVVGIILGIVLAYIVPIQEITDYFKYLKVRPSYEEGVRDFYMLELDKARDSFNSDLVDYPDYPLLYIGLSKYFSVKAYLAQWKGQEYRDDFKSALEYAIRAYSVNVDESEYLKSLAYILLLSGDPRGKFVADELMNFIEKDDPEAQYLSWVAGGRNINDKKSIDLIENAIKIKSDFLLGRLDYARKLSEDKKDLETAEYHFKAVKERNPNIGLVYNAMGIFNCFDKKYNEARDKFQTALNIEGGNLPQACNNIGVSYCYEARYNEAVEWLERAINLNPKLVESQTNLAEALYELGLTHEALNRWKEAVEVDFQDLDANCGLALGYYTIGEHSLASFFWERVLNLDSNYYPESPPWLRKAYTTLCTMIEDFSN